MSTLTSLANVKQWLTLTTTTDDAMLTRLIAAASTFIETWLNRTLGQQQYTETRNGNGKQTMLLGNYPVTAVTGVQINGAPVLPSAAFGQAGYTFDGTTLYLTSYTFARGRQNVQIQYTAGYATIPLDIEQACIDLVCVRYKERQRIGEQSKAINGETVSFMIKDLSPFALSVLQNYKRVVQP
ncbi:head-tail connector protein [Paludibacterium purpuratum]|uniref:Putative phiE125 gp8 family phage protein n=1 Tax=Paludibacterium purpuratum TaxID=1144873 RepID=A0A4R7BDE3_9NEIS|nr:head-tail connector protein [Paludibacterium purpuratum]TDR82202.1 putative phiE125 gp8 family phage protein [Paludibacterium purpuratum]